MKNVQLHSVLFFYDVPQIILCSDVYGGQYVGVFIENDTYYFAGVSPKTLNKFQAGEIDLLQLLTEFAGEEWFAAAWAVGSDTISLTVQTGVWPTSKLPLPGFVLEPSTDDSEVLSEAKRKERLIVELTVNSDKSVGSKTLAGYLDGFQSVVDYSHRVQLRSDSNGLLARTSGLDVYDALAGSFKVRLQDPVRADLLGRGNLHKAMDALDTLFSKMRDPSQGVQTIDSVRGHLAGAILRLFRFLVENETSLRYCWADSSLESPSSHYIAPSVMQSILEQCNDVSSLTTERIEFRGVLEKADIANGNWRVATNAGVSLSGHVKEGGPTLDGLTLGKEYTFVCSEEIEVEAIGKEHRKFYLLETPR